MKDGKRRFSNRAAVYARHRPSYPAEMLPFLRKGCELKGDSVVADVGSGTGILSRLFLENGNRVFGVEPNREMREAAERLLGHRASFESVAGSAEETTLAANSVDLVAVGNALHWIDVDAARAEFARVLKPGGRVVVAWNVLRRSGDAFHDALQRLILKHSMVGSEDLADLEEWTSDRTRSLFGADGYEKACFPNEQILDLEGLKGLVLSFSVLPAEGEPGSVGMLRDLEGIFDADRFGGSVVMRYVARVYCGRLR